MLSTNRTLRLLLLAGPVVALAVAAVVLAFGPGNGNKAQADFPHAGLDFSIASAGCDSTAGPTTCTVAAGATFTLAVKVNTVPAGLTFDGYDSVLQYTGGLTVNEASLSQTGAGNWPDCTFAAHFAAPGQLAAGCGHGIGAASSSYTGQIYHVDFTCPSPAPASPASITLVSGFGNTSLTDASAEAHGEGADEKLTVTCGASGGPVDTPTPTNTTGPQVTPTNTSVPTTPGPATATNTPRPATATNTPRPPTATPSVTKGDVNGDGRIDSTDALWVLWDEAGIVDDVPLPENADVNHDGRTNSIDALFILWMATNRI